MRRPEDLVLQIPTGALKYFEGTNKQEAELNESKFTALFIHNFPVHQHCSVDCWSVLLWQFLHSFLHSYVQHWKQFYKWHQMQKSRLCSITALQCHMLIMWIATECCLLQYYSFQIFFARYRFYNKFVLCQGRFWTVNYLADSHVFSCQRRYRQILYTSAFQDWFYPECFHNNESPCTLMKFYLSSHFLSEKRILAVAWIIICLIKCVVHW